MNTIIKEEHNNFVIPLPALCSLFEQQIFLMPEHNLVKGGKKERLIFNAAKRPTMDSFPINLMTSTKHNPKLGCKFGVVIANLLVHIWNLWISFPDQGIALHANDVKSCFQQLKHHPGTRHYGHLLIHHLQSPISTMQPHFWNQLQPCQLGTHLMCHGTASYCSI